MNNKISQVNFFVNVLVMIETKFTQIKSDYDIKCPLAEYLQEEISKIQCLQTSYF